MRLDLFLKASRICARRTVAQQLCDAGLVTINGAPSKSAHPVKAGDEITIKRHGKVSTLKVLSVPDRRQTAKHDARQLYELVNVTETSSEY